MEGRATTSGPRPPGPSPVAPCPGRPAVHARQRRRPIPPVRPASPACYDADIRTPRASRPRLARTAVGHLEPVLARVEPVDASAEADARAHQRLLTKPPGSLGRLERLASQIAGIRRTAAPRLARKVVVVMAADHGVASEGVSAYPQVVTAQMVRNFAQGGAAINVLARAAGARVAVVDVGVAEDLPATLPIVHRKVAYGTANITRGPAMSLDQTLQAIEVGLSVVEDHRDAQVMCLGEMGIANTTSTAAILAALTGLPASAVTGRGTGIDDLTWQRKVAVVEQALAANDVASASPLQVLRRLGGLEIAGLVGVVLGAAAHHQVIVVDGFIASVAALLAVEMCPLARGYLIAAHRSMEVGHNVVLQRLELEPLFSLDLRLGEASGAALALPLLDAAVALLHDMATFEQAGISTAVSRAHEHRRNA